MKFPLNSGIGISIVLLCVGQICEIEIFYEMNRAKFSIPDVIFLSSSS